MSDKHLSDSELASMQESASEAAALLKALANSDRLLLLCQLTQGELSVSELEARSGISQPSLSQQLSVLRNKSLVSTRKSGKQVFYRLQGVYAQQIMQTLYQLYCAPSSNTADHP